jgi:hypothetical protein
MCELVSKRSLTPREERILRMRFGIGPTPSAPAHGRMFAFSIVCAPGLACGVSIAMTLILSGGLR